MSTGTLRRHREAAALARAKAKDAPATEPLVIDEQLVKEQVEPIKPQKRQYTKKSE